MKKISLIIIVLLFLSCKKEVVKLSKPNSNPKLDRGEWLGTSDTVNGISIRENRIAFFKKMVFNSDQIFNYRIVDSIYKNDKTEKIVGEYLIVEKPRDTTVYRITQRNEKVISLIDSKGISKTYNFWR